MNQPVGHLSTNHLNNWEHNQLKHKPQKLESKTKQTIKIKIVSNSPFVHLDSVYRNVNATQYNIILLYGVAFVAFDRLLL